MLSRRPPLIDCLQAKNRTHAALSVDSRWLAAGGRPCTWAGNGGQLMQPGFETHGPELFSGMLKGAAASPRLRAHHSLHLTTEEPCQRLFIALQRGSYIPPHRHLSDPKRETLMAFQGLMALATFTDAGAIDDIVLFGSEAWGGGHICPVALTLADPTWHTVVAITQSAVLFETKPGPFRPERGKEPCPWAPDEGSLHVAAFQLQLDAAIGPALATFKPELRRFRESVAREPLAGV
jgi:cupin fold WbuC family metalloprotein